MYKAGCLVTTWQHSTKAKGNHPERFPKWQFWSFVCKQCCCTGLEISELTWLFKTSTKGCGVLLSLFGADRQNWKDRDLHVLLSAQVKQKADTKFKPIGVPSATEIIKASSKEVIRLLDSLPPTTTGLFMQSAKKLIEDEGATLPHQSARAP